MKRQIVRPRFQLEHKAFDAAFQKWLGVAGLSVREAMRTQGRLLFDRIINWRGGAIGTPPKNATQGKRAVQRDVYRAVFPLRAKGFNDVRIRKRVQSAIDGLDNMALQKMTRAGVFGPGLRKAIVAPFNPKFHTSQRRSRGRVTGNSNRMRYLYATPDVDKIKAYIEKKQKNVGMAKGGWVSALTALGGKAAAWYAKHRNQGTHSDHLKDKVPYFEAFNHSPWAASGEDDRIVEMAMVGREMAMQKDIERRIAEAWGG